MKIFQSLVFAALLLSTLSAFSQQSAPTGFPPFGTFQDSEFDTVNVGSLNVHFEIPIVSKAGRGMPFVYKLVYDSSLWVAIQSTNAYGNIIWTWSPKNLGYGWDVGSISGYVTYDTKIQRCDALGDTLTERINYAFHEPNGTAHSFGAAAIERNDCGGHTGGFPPTAALDGTGYMLAVDSSFHPTVTTPSGAVIAAPQTTPSSGYALVNTGTITDSNGNQISGFTDTLGLSAITIGGTPSASTYTYPSPTNPANLVGVTVNSTSYTLQTNFGCANVVSFEYGPQSVSLISSIVMPDGGTYVFGYEGTPGYPGSVTGRISSITLPSGGTISFTYTGGANGATCLPGSGNGVLGFTSGVPPVLTRTTPDGVWTYTRNATTSSPFSTTTIVDPKGNTDVITMYGANQTGYADYELKRQSYQGSSTGTLLRTIETCYNGNAFPCSANASFGVPISRKTVRTEWPDTTGSLSQTDTLFNTVGLNTASLVTDVSEYDYGSGGPPTTPIRTTHIDYAALGNNIQDRPSVVTVKDGTGNILSQTTYGYDETAPTSTSGIPNHVAISGSRGNQTSVTQLIQGTTTRARTTSYYDTGTPNVVKDFNRNPTTYGYGSGSCGGAFPTSITNALNQTVSATWDCNGAVKTSQTDANNQPTSFVFGDPNFWRPTATNYADGGQVATTYNLASPPWSIVRTTKLGTSPPLVNTPLVNTTVYDSLGRARQTQLNSDPQGITYVDTSYDATGRVSTVSNPHRSTSSLTDGVTTTYYDALGRVAQIAGPDGTLLSSGTPVTQCQANNSCTDYSQFPTVTVTDEAGKKRSSRTDALGRLTTVFEDPAGLNYETDYQYNALGNLLRVDQKGSAPATSGQWRTRTFSYNSLSRLITAYNPESGTTCYGVWVNGNCVNGYDANGNLLAKTDARGITTSYSYDALNRVTQTTFSNGDPTLTFTYDQSPDPTWGAGSSVGHLVRALKTGLGSHWFRYDAMGRVSRTWQCLPSNCSAGASVAAQYDLAGGLTQLTYPNGQIVNYTPDAAGRDVSAIDSGARFDWPTGTTSNTGTTTNFATAATYGPDNGLTGFISGANPASGFAGIVNTFVYNNRLQLCRTAASTTGAAPTSCTNSFGNVLDLNYDYHPPGTGDNGNVYAITNYRDTTRSQTFAYDSLNRLISAQTNGTDCTKKTLNPNQTVYWGNSYTYDAWGNLLAKTVTKCSAEPLNESADTQNRMHVISGPDYSYDAAGNMTYDVTDGHGYTYDAQSQIILVDGGAANYIYDAKGHRLRKDSAGSPSTEYVYFGDQIVAEKNVNVPLQASMLTQSGLTAFVPGAIGDGNVASQGWRTDSASAGAWLQVDLGSVRNITGVGIYAASSGYAGTYNVQYSDNAASWSQAGSITPSAGGWNAAGWSSVGAHRYWRLYLANTPGPGPWLTELQLQGNTPWTNYIFFEGERVARQDSSSNAVTYYFSDHLKTATVITDAAGTIKSESDYYPWGGELQLLANDANHYKFTGKERDDNETGLDYFGARYYSQALGRFITPDPIFMTKNRITDPQQWNVYSYVRNNPLRYTDPSGLDFYLTCKQTKKNDSTCQGGHVGTTTIDANGNKTFTPTVVTSASLQDPKSGNTATVTGGGVKITTASGTYTGQFINGTPAATIQGSGVLSPFTFNITGQAAGNLLYGTFKFNGTPAQAESYMSSHGAWSYPLDVVNIFHPNTKQFRFSDPKDPSGPSIHLSLPYEMRSSMGPGYGVGFELYPSASGGPFHVDSHGTTMGHIEDIWDVITRQ